MIRKADPPNRPWKPRWNPRNKRRRRLRPRACAGYVRGRVLALLASRDRARGLMEITLAPGLVAMPRALVLGALRSLVARGEVREVLVVAGPRGGTTWLSPRFYHRRWDGLGRAEHG